MQKGLIVYLVCDLVRDTKLDTWLLSDDETLMGLLLLKFQHAFWALACTNYKVDPPCV